jgi:hypothetical protein
MGTRLFYNGNFIFTLIEAREPAKVVGGKDVVNINPAA